MARRKSESEIKRQDKPTGKGREPEVPPLRQAVMYARVSSKDQEREGFSIPAQQALLRSYAQTHGLHIKKEFIDVETAKKAGRTNFTEMLRILRKHKGCRIVLVEKTDRLYRNLKDWVTLDELGLEIHLVKEGVVLTDDSRSTDKFMHGIRVLMAKNYIDNLSEEITKGLKEKAAEGHWPSGAPLGYRNQRQAGKSFIVPDERESSLVRSLFEFYDMGRHSLSDLTRYAEGVGLKGRRGGRLKDSAIHHILQNPIYAGEFDWCGIRYKSKDPTLVDMDLFERVQERLHGTNYERNPELDFAFTGLVVCGKCGYGLSAELKKEKYIYYRCVQRCSEERYLREERLEELIVQEIRKLRFPGPLLEVVAHVLRDSRREIKADIEGRMQAARGRYDRAGYRIDQAYEDKLDGKIDDAFFQRKKVEWDQERAGAWEELERLKKADEEDLELGINLLELANACSDAYLRQEKRERRKLIESLISNFSYRHGRLEVKWRKPFDLIAQLSEACQKEKAPSGSPEGAHRMWWS